MRESSAQTHRPNPGIDLSYIGNMPKDWEEHKAQFEQLYVSEGKTLDEVKSILESQHGFQASYVFPRGTPSVLYVQRI